MSFRAPENSQVLSEGREAERAFSGTLASWPTSQIFLSVLFGEKV